ncbi:phage tail protein, partial [Klebsiella pneumoniae]|nr:phage tail protein [Klebsiella pneumoniae]
IGGGMSVAKHPDPSPPGPGTRPVEMWSDGELVSKWDE